ncbi:MAG: hypothetical protein J7K46_11365 [Bacteroidales bacterium]|nr:hypothetical protein [Bacteroidales bacterium]
MNSITAMIPKHFSSSGAAVCLFLLLVFSPAILAAQDSIRFPEMKGYNLHFDYPVYFPDNLWDYIDGAADNYLNYHFVNLHIAEYYKGNNKVFFKVEIYRHESPLYAFGIYSSERSPDYHFINLGVQGFQEESLIYFLKGPYYVKILTQQEGRRAGRDIEVLAHKLETMLAGTTRFPPELALFPEKNKIANSERFIASAFLGHEFFDSVFTTQYQTGDVSFSMFLTHRATVENTKKLLETFCKNATGQIPQPLKEGDRVIKDGYNGDIYLIWQGNIIFGFRNLKDQVLMRQMAEEVLSKL